MSLDDFSAADHVVVVSEGTGHGQADELLRRKKIARKVVLTVPHYVAVGHILHDTDLVATVPERLAQALVKPFGLSYVPSPGQAPRDRDQPVLARSLQQGPCERMAALVDRPASR